MTALLLSIVAAVVSAVAAYGAWRARQLAADLGQRYADAIGLIAAIAVIEPPVASPDVREKCARLLDAHHVEVTRGGTVH